MRTIMMLALAVGVVPVPEVQAATQYWISGRGWGHGIGMSQYGAYGFARAGYAHDQIIRHYYQGSAVQALGTASSVDVALVTGKVSTAIEIDAAGTMVHEGVTVATQVGDVYTSKLESGVINVYRTRAGVTRRVHGGDTVPTWWHGPAGSLQSRFRSMAGATNHHYRGSMRVQLFSGRIAVINRLGLEPYLQGVVPAEVPPSWATCPAGSPSTNCTAVLRAQAIAARSYAVATRRNGAFDQYADTRSQVYRGIEEEEAPTNAAIAATAGLVAKVGGVTIPTFFHSTSGGRTASIHHVWNSEPRSYLTTVADPYERSPYSSWPLKIVSGPTMASKLSGYINGGLRNVAISVNGSSRAGNVTVVGSGGNTSMKPTTFQYRLGLRSTWFRVIKLSIVSNDYYVSRGAYVRLSGNLPRSGSNELWYRPASSTTWAKLKNIYPTTSNTWATSARVPRSRVFRIKRNGTFGPAILVKTP